MDLLTDLAGFVVEQEAEWSESFSGVPVRHRYRVLDLDGAYLATAEELQGSEVARTILKGYRPFTIAVWDAQRRKVLEIKRPLRLHWAETWVRDARLRPAGRIVLKRSVTHRRYAVQDREGNELGVLQGSLVRTYRFEILRNGLPFGTLYRAERQASDKRSADNSGFGATFHGDFPAATKALFLAAGFLVDFVHFERQPW